MLSSAMCGSRWKDRPYSILEGFRYKRSTEAYKNDGFTKHFRDHVGIESETPFCLQITKAELSGSPLGARVPQNEL